MVRQLACDRCMNRKMEFKTSDRNMNPTMIAAETFENILMQIQNSNLNFKLELSPFAAKISLKKTLTTDKSGIPIFPRANCETAALAAKDLQLENELFYMKNQFLHEVHESGTDVHQELAESRAHVDKLQKVIANLEIENEEFRNKVKNLEIDVHDQEISNKIQKEVSERLNKKISELKAKFEKEKTEMAKKNKSEVKYWRKELGEETKIKMKLRKIIEDKERVDSKAMEEKGASNKKKNENFSTKSEPVTKEDETLCSICASLNLYKYFPHHYLPQLYNFVNLLCA